ncbi:MAG: hypothetical protein MUC49_05375 [Raineya sp.]|jgi:tetratricopeptide (TPR) repeat protein|nr:hypothetical protein [Raineya sp.]
MNEEHNIDEFVKKVLQIHEQNKNSKLSHKDLHAIAQELGVSLETLEKEIKKYQQRGEGFLKFNNIEDALQALEQAYTLHPENIETLKMLVKAYFLNWKQTKDITFRTKALEKAEEMLVQDSDNNFAFALISHIKKIDKTPSLLNQDDSFLWEENKKKEITQNVENQEVKEVHKAKVKYTNTSSKKSQKHQKDETVKYNGYDVIILEKNEKGKCKIRYIGWGDSWDEWVNLEDIENPAEYKNKPKGKYKDYDVIILEKNEKGKCKIRYLGYGSNWDEWVNLEDVKELK